MRSALHPRTDPSCDRRRRHARPAVPHSAITQRTVATTAAALPRPHSSPAVCTAAASVVEPEAVRRRSCAARATVSRATAARASGAVASSDRAIQDRPAPRLLTRPASASDSLRSDCERTRAADRRRIGTSEVAELQHRLHLRSSSGGGCGSAVVRKPCFDFRSQLLLDLALTQAPACRRLGGGAGHPQLWASVLQPMRTEREEEEEEEEETNDDDEGRRRLWRGWRQQPQPLRQQGQRRQPDAGMHFDDLPLECRLLVFSYLTQRQKGRCLTVCRAWYDELRAGQLWTRVNLDELPLCGGAGHGTATSAVPAPSAVASADGFRNGEAALGQHACRPAGHPGGCVGNGGPYGDLVHCGWPCYARYQRRVDGYVSFLAAIRPRVRSLALSLDVGADGWCAVVERLLLGLDLSQLQHARINWKETPARPFWLDGAGSTTAGAGSRSSAAAAAVTSAASAPSLESHFTTSRVRQAVFTRLFELFVGLAPSLRTLAMPFDWSPASVDGLLQLRSLRCLALDKYFVLQTLQPSLLARAVAGLPELRWLRLEIWTPPPAAVAAAASRRARDAGGSGKGDRATTGAEAMLHVLANETLEHLDIWACRGFYLRAVALPSLRSLRVRRYPWNGPLTTRDKFDVPCLGAVLAAGAPQLLRINELELSPACWRRLLLPSSDGSARSDSVVSRTTEGSETESIAAADAAAITAIRLCDLLRQVCSCHEHRRTAIL